MSDSSSVTPSGPVRPAWIFRALAALPLRWLHRLGAALGWLVYWGSPTYRARLRANLARACPEPAPALLHAAIREAGRQALEVPWVLLRPQAEVVAQVRQVEGWELVEAARAAGEGVLFLTPHLGCFEIVAQYISTHHPLTVLYRRPKKTILQPVIEAGRGRGQIQLAPADVGGVRRLVKRLREQGMVGMLPDQAPAAGEGLWAPFFGHLAWTMTLAARLSEVKGVRVICTWAERLPDGQGYVIRMSPPGQPLEGDTAQRACQINREMERLILQCPAQYLWGYHRYKRPAGVPPREEAAC